jgi:hypothetical protein
MFIPDKYELSKAEIGECDFTVEEQQQMEQAFLDYSHGVNLYRELIRVEIDPERILLLKSLLMSYQEDNK